MKQNFPVTPNPNAGRKLSMIFSFRNEEDVLEELITRVRSVLKSEQDKDILDGISKSNNKIINTAGLLKLYEVPSVIRKSKLFIGNDSGLTHIALKLNVPIIAIIGGGNYGKFFPYNEENPDVVYLFDKMDCFGCEWKCIYKERFCLTNVKMSTILDNVKKLI